MRLLLLTLATFWAWATVRYVCESYAPRAFAVTRPIHPLVVAALPLWYLWPDWVAGLGVAGAVGLLVAGTDRLFGAVSQQAVTIQRPRRRGGLPPLP